MKKYSILWLLMCLLINVKAQNLEVSESPWFISFEDDLPVLGISVYNSKNPFEMVLCVYAEDDIKFNNNSNLTIQLENSEIVIGQFMKEEGANRDIIIDVEHTTWHFKKQPHAIFSISKTYLQALKTQDLKRLVLYKVNSTNNPEKRIYTVKAELKGALKFLLEKKGL